jgi:hypothetical protein
MWLRQPQTGSISATDSAEEKGILVVASDLCKFLGVETFTPKAIRWVTWFIVPHGKVLGNPIVPSDHCFFEDNDIALARTLKEKFTAQDWRPLIASSLIHEFNKGIGRRRSVLRPARY